MTDLSGAIDLDPDYAWAFGARGEMYRLMGRYSEALTDFDRAIELDPADTWVVDRRGQLPDV